MRDPYFVGRTLYFVVGFLVMNRLFPFLLLLLLVGARQPSSSVNERQAFSPDDNRRPRSLRVMEWNVENLFDTVHDEGFQDQEFLPTSERRWTSHRCWQKMTELAKVIAAVGEEGGIPDIIGLCEVENDSVLTMFTRRSVLRHLGYHYVITHSEDQRGVDVALLYQPVRFGLIDSRSIRVPSKEHGFRPTRDFLHVRGRVLTSTGVDTLNVIVVHLPSRAGGSEGDRNRALAARTLWAVADSIVGSGGRLLVMGDFNASSSDRIFRRTPLLCTDDPHDAGTYCFQGFWEWLDHIYVSTEIQTRGKARTVRFPWLLEENKTYGCEMPWRTYRGPAYHGGVSDHLPVLLDLLW